MKYDIKARDSLTDLERAEFEVLSHAVYPPGAPRSGAENKEWSSSTWGVFVRDDADRLVSFIGMITRQVKCDDTPIFMGGIGGVKTHPDCRGQGYAGFGLQKAVDFFCDDLNVDFSLLVCRDELVPYYRKFGWTLFEGDLLVEQPSGITKLALHKAMVLAGNKPVPQCSVIDLCGKPW